MIADKDLLSVQQSRILAENAREAAKKLALFPQEKLDEIVEHVAAELEKEARSFALMSYEETDYGNWQDKWIKNQFVCSMVRKALRGMRCVGVLGRDQAARTVDIGVPIGVIAALSPVTSPVSTTVYKALLAIKSGNAIIFSPHPKAVKCISAALDIVIRAAAEKGLPEGAVSYMDAVAKRGTVELMNHPAVSLLMLTEVPGMLGHARRTGKPVIYGGTGNGPSFIERSADIGQAVRDIIRSKTFDNGIAPSAEHSVVVDACVAAQVKKEFLQNGAYFMTLEESQRLADLFYCPDGRCLSGHAGLPAEALARRAGIAAPAGVKLLLAERKYVTIEDPYCKGIPAPALACYEEDDWMHACEKCIELLLHERNAHTMTIHSKDEDVIMQFALKKPVGRLLVNTPASLGGMGATTNLFPSLTLGSGSAGFGITADNVSPMNLIYVRKVGYGVRSLDGGAELPRSGYDPARINAFAASSADLLGDAQILKRVLSEAVKALK